MANSIVSDEGFKALGNQQSHQSKWKKSVYEVYQDASLNVDWTPILAETCRKAEIDFFTSPYAIDLVDAVDEYMPAYKIGSGDITFHELIKYIAKKEKPVLLATGASTFDEVNAAMDVICQINQDVVLMQCNTNYTGSIENFKYSNLNVLKQYTKKYPKMILGLSDHTMGHSTALASIALGARLIEKHFTDDNGRDGPDHSFAMSPESWREMIDRSREVEISLGDGIKVVEENEKQTAVLQRRSLRATKDLKKGQIVEFSDVESLRPAPENSLAPYRVDEVIGVELKREITKGAVFEEGDL